MRMTIPIPTSAQLLSTCRAHCDFRALLRRDYPDLDDETFADTLEGLSDFQDMLSELIRSLLDDQALLAGLAERFSDMRARQARLSERIHKKRALALTCLEEAQVQRLTRPDFTALVRAAAPSLNVLHEAEIPRAFWKPQPPVLDRHALLAALKRGETVAGVALATPSHQLSVRTR